MIPRNLLGQGCKLSLLNSLALAGAIASGAGDFTFAQEVIADPSVGTDVRPNGTTYEIRGGTTVGDTNLFHSFSSFSVPSGWTASFLDTSTITNILARVTGGIPSNIQGVLQAQGTANLFLINPSGIIFGPGARLDIGGSFVGTTANAIQFPGGGEFSMTSPVEPQNSLLTVNPSALFFNQIAAAPITSQARLQVDSGMSLLLVGGNVQIEGGRLQTSGGRIELGGVAGTGTVGLEVDGNNLRLSFPNDVTLADVSLSNGATVSVSGTTSGNIQVQGKRVILAEGSEIRVNNSGSQPGGTLTVRASELVELLEESRLLADTVNTGTGGELRIETGQLIVRDGSQVSASTFNEGQGGTLTVMATELVELSGDSSGLRATAGEDATGTAGELRIETGQLIVEDGAQVSASTLGQGQGGTLTVTATESVQLSGSSANGNPSALFTVARGDATGTAGELRIDSKRLIVEDGAQVSASTVGEGQGGSLTVTASESVELSGTSRDGQIPGGLLVGTTGNAVAGNIRIETGQLIVEDGAIVSARTSSQGNGGNITLQVRDLLLLRGNSQISGGNSQISANAGIQGAGGDGGNIDIDAALIVAFPSENSDIIADAFEGNGGNIDITSQGIFGIEFREELTRLSDINASSEFGVNGVVQINNPDVDPSRSLTRLPTEPVDASSLIVLNCPVSGENGAQNEFIVTGRGGLPPNPSEPLSSEAVWIDWRIPSTVGSSRDSDRVTTRTVTPPPSTANRRPPLVEAQGWVYNNKGQVVLIAAVPTATPQSPWLPPACRQS